MIVCPVQPFDMPQIMNIERQSFIPAIQEKKKVFEKRLKAFPQGFLALADCSDKIVLERGSALVCAYLCCERWDSIPDFSETKLLQKRFALGHNPLFTHKETGCFLYVSSFALLKDYRGRGLGQKFFQNCLAALCSSMPEIRKVVILVDSEWENALKIYRKLGFKEESLLEGFFPTIQKKVSADGLIMTAEADSFRNIEFSSSPNELGGIRID